MEQAKAEERAKELDEQANLHPKKLYVHAAAKQNAPGGAALLRRGVARLLRPQRVTRKSVWMAVGVSLTVAGKEM